MSSFKIECAAADAGGLVVLFFISSLPPSSTADAGLEDSKTGRDRENISKN
jgi:hypothetical protein